MPKSRIFATGFWEGREQFLGPVLDSLEYLVQFMDLSHAVKSIAIDYINALSSIDG